MLDIYSHVLILCQQLVLLDQTLMVGFLFCQVDILFSSYLQGLKQKGIQVADPLTMLLQDPSAILLEMPSDIISVTDRVCGLSRLSLAAKSARVGFGGSGAFGGFIIVWNSSQLIFPSLSLSAKLNISSISSSRT